MAQLRNILGIDVIGRIEGIVFSPAGCGVLILTLALVRFHLAPDLGCPVQYDCNSYIQMAATLKFDPLIPPHHAMRVLPPFLVHGLHALLDIPLYWGFKILTYLSYIAWGGGCFLILRKLPQLTPRTHPSTHPSIDPLSVWDREGIFFLSMTVLLMAMHAAMLVPLEIVYQTTDMMSYPIVLAVLYGLISRHDDPNPNPESSGERYVYWKWIFIPCLVGILVRQNIFVLSLLVGIKLVFDGIGVVSLADILNRVKSQPFRQNTGPASIRFKDRRLLVDSSIFLAFALIEYACLTGYYRAQGALLRHIIPTAVFFANPHC